MCYMYQYWVGNGQMVNIMQLQRGELKFDRLIRKLQLQDADLHKE